MVLNDAELAQAVAEVEGQMNRLRSHRMEQAKTYPPSTTPQPTFSLLSRLVNTHAQAVHIHKHATSRLDQQKMAVKTAVDELHRSAATMHSDVDRKHQECKERLRKAASDQSQAFSHAAQQAAQCASVTKASAESLATTMEEKDNTTFLRAILHAMKDCEAVLRANQLPITPADPLPLPDVRIEDHKDETIAELLKNYSELESMYAAVWDALETARAETRASPEGYRRHATLLQLQRERTPEEAVSRDLVTEAQLRAAVRDEVDVLSARLTRSLEQAISPSRSVMPRTPSELQQRSPPFASRVNQSRSQDYRPPERSPPFPSRVNQSMTARSPETHAMRQQLSIGESRGPGGRVQRRRSPSPIYRSPHPSFFSPNHRSSLVVAPPPPRRRDSHPASVDTPALVTPLPAAARPPQPDPRPLVPTRGSYILPGSLPDIDD